MNTSLRCLVQYLHVHLEWSWRWNTQPGSGSTGRDDLHDAILQAQRHLYEGKQNMFYHPVLQRGVGRWMLTSSPTKRGWLVNVIIQSYKAESVGECQPPALHRGVGGWVSTSSATARGRRVSVNLQPYKKGSVGESRFTVWVQHTHWLAQQFVMKFPAVGSCGRRN